ncbi:MAG TPA: carbohydrate kinase [Ktedonobacteraceae bacterium]|nr:carbohydrate kinase [Ktedonobacteraceae bacterium]
MSYALFVGEMLIDFIPLANGQEGVPSYQPHPGGAVANAAVALARLGGSARFVGKLGEDSFGQLLLHTLQKNKVDTRFTPLTRLGPTTMVLVTLQENGLREFTFYRQGTSDTLLEIDDLIPQAWEDVVLLHAGSVLLSTEPSRKATLHALEYAHRQAIPVSFDVNVRTTLWPLEATLRETLAGVIPRVNLLKFSSDEAHYLDPTRSTPFDAEDSSGLQALGQKLLAQGPTLVVLTRGPLGALLMTPQQSIEVPATTLAAIDTTGAGDAFMGALLHQLIDSQQVSTNQLAHLSAEELQRLGQYANRAAGLSCTRYGGIASLPFPEEMQAI